MRRLIFTLILILAGYVGYMYFFGKGEDKAKAEVIVSETKDLGKAVGDFLSKQKEKYDDGEFDRLIDKVSNSLEKLKSGSGQKNEEVKDDLRKLQDELKQVDPSKLNDENRRALQKLIDDVDQQLKQ
jgi:flagellar basal body-associated protein FliL